MGPTRPAREGIQGLLACAAAIVLCLLALAWVMKLWRADLRVPFLYQCDGLLIQALVKGVIDNGWYLHNDFLGAPVGLDLHDFPLDENLHLLIIKLISWVFPDPAITTNLFFLLTFPLTTLSALFVLHHFRLSTGPALVASLLFTFLPYHFFRGEAHLFLASYYLIPPAVMVILWLYLTPERLVYRGGEEERPGPIRVKRRPVAAALICVLVASAGIYYAFFTCFFLLVAGVAACLSRKKLYPLGPAVVLIALTTAGVIANLSPNLIYRYRHGPNPEAVDRHPAGAEIYGMKVAQLLLPVSGHRWPLFARFKAGYNGPLTPLINENEGSSLGALGALGFLALCGLLLCPKPAAGRARVHHGLALLNASAVLLGTIGGLGSVFSFLITSRIRGYNRISIFIGFFALFALGLFLEWARARYARTGKARLLFTGFLGALLAAGILDQTTCASIPPYDRMGAEYHRDHTFIRRIEASVPEQALIFQLPYTSFPEPAPLQRMGDYQHLRAYLHSRRLHWSYGAMRGRRGDLWEKVLAGQALTGLVATLAHAGFSGIYLDRDGFADNGRATEAELVHLLGTPPLVSEDQKLSFFNLATYSRRLQARTTQEEWAAQREQALYPVTAQWRGGFSALEGTADNNWRWCSATGELYLDNPGHCAREVTLHMGCQTACPEPASLRIESPWFSVVLEASGNSKVFARTVVVPPGTSTVRFSCDGKPLHVPGDLRDLVFQVRDFTLSECLVPSHAGRY